MMKFLALETSTDLASVAVMKGDDLFYEEQGGQRTHAQLILPMIQRLMLQADLQMDHLDGIIFGCGPGSFTGLRVCCSIAKGLAYAHDLDLIPVSSLDAIAWTAREPIENAQAPVLALLDARMGEFYWSYFNAKTLLSSASVSASSKIQIPNQEAFILAGSDINRQHLPQELSAKISSQLSVFPDARALIHLAMKAQLKPVPLFQAQPLYVRNQVTQGGSHE